MALSSSLMARLSRERYRAGVLRPDHARVEPLRRRLAPRRPRAPERGEADRDEAVCHAS